MQRIMPLRYENRMPRTLLIRVPCRRFSYMLAKRRVPGGNGEVSRTRYYTLLRFCASRLWIRLVRHAVFGTSR